ncbi:MAG: hypothetical protein KBA26_02505 [Candidatus Delongbacteria bacterium]|nr:hypothetical protein [Candidatus Delongbacteria bacterium]
MEWSYRIPPWVDSDSRVVISHRLRYSRNLNRIPFVDRAEPDRLIQVMQDLDYAMKQTGRRDDWDWIPLKPLTSMAINGIKEFFYIDRLPYPDPKIGLWINPGSSEFMMLNATDHIKLIGLYPGKDTLQNMMALNRLDDSLSPYMEYAYHPDFGHLSPCPTNTGTGFKASFLLHLPAASITEQIRKVCRIVSEKNCSLKSLSLIGKSNVGNLFIVENNLSFGLNEETIMYELIKTVDEVEQMELQSEEFLKEKLLIHTQDKVFRAWGILTNAAVLSLHETVNLLSAVRLGVRLHLLREDLIRIINQLFVSIMPAHLRYRFGMPDATEEAVDQFRALLIKEALLNQAGHHE